MVRKKVTIKEMEDIVKQMKRDLFLMAYNSGTKGAHVGGSLSSMEILATLYAQVMNYDTANPLSDQRDRFIMSKAHCAIGLYAALKMAGFLKQEDIEAAMQKNSVLFKHPKMDIKRGIEFSGGSLGQGLSLAVGSALALRKRNNSQSQFYVLMGDGELDEGSVWEALNSVIHFNLKNITVIIDNNGLQNDGLKTDIMNIGNLQKRLEAVGFSVFEVNGHDLKQLAEVFMIHTDFPKAIIANTNKGNGISFSHNKVDWHINYVTKELYDQAIVEIG
ncbi:transketolase [Clostridiales bacterium COT073_COT-073]|nr:transketolase [Clostridiales bacterium COT073_COT-073]